MAILIYFWYLYILEAEEDIEKEELTYVAEIIVATV